MCSVPQAGGGLEPSWEEGTGKEGRGCRGDWRWELQQENGGPSGEGTGRE